MPDLTGTLRKMSAQRQQDGMVHYSLVLNGESVLTLNDRLGEALRLEYTGRRVCVACGRLVPKVYANGYCYPCFSTLPECDLCMVRPELCHFAQGTCRDANWGLAHCFQSHTVYLARTSGLKVGITRSKNLPTRWIDQGAVEALPLATVRNRRDSGLVEVRVARDMADRTDWRRMLRGPVEAIPFAPWVTMAREAIEELGLDVEWPHADVLAFTYPLLAVPTKVTARRLERIGHIEGALQGIKGQYLIFPHGVLNVRSHSGYEVRVSY